MSTNLLRRFVTGAYLYQPTAILAANADTSHYVGPYASPPTINGRTALEFALNGSLVAFITPIAALTDAAAATSVAAWDIYGVVRLCRQSGNTPGSTEEIAGSMYEYLGQLSATFRIANTGGGSAAQTAKGTTGTLIDPSFNFASGVSFTKSGDATTPRGSYTAIETALNEGSTQTVAQTADATARATLALPNLMRCSALIAKLHSVGSNITSANLLIRLGGQ